MYIRYQKEMLSKVIKDMLEKKYGHKVRYHKDCQGLAAHISTTCKTTISASTLSHLYGFDKRTQEPRLYTLDLISEYLGYDSWERLTESLTKMEASAFVSVEQLTAEKLRIGSIVEFGYEPTRLISIKYLGKYKFEVLHSKNSKLQPKDILKIQTIALHYPLLISEVVRDGENIGQYHAGKLSGITHLRKLKDEKVT